MDMVNIVHRQLYGLNYASCISLPYPLWKLERKKKYKEKRFSLLATEQNNHGFGKLSQSEFTFQSDYLNITMGRKKSCKTKHRMLSYFSSCINKNKFLWLWFTYLHRANTNDRRLQETLYSVSTILACKYLFLHFF